MESNQTEPKGIGGWLILPLLGLIFSAFQIAFQFIGDLAPVLTIETWHVLTTPGTNAYHPLWAPLLVFEVVASVVLFSFTLALLRFFFKKSKRVPKLFVLWLLSVAAVQVIDYLLMAQIPSVSEQPDPAGMRDLIRSVGSAAIWIPYFLKSTRVKNTFVAPLS